MSEFPGHVGHIELPVRGLCSILVRALPRLSDTILIALAGFIEKVKEFLECICVHWERLKADIVSFVSLS